MAPTTGPGTMDIRTYPPDPAATNPAGPTPATRRYGAVLPAPAQCEEPWRCPATELLVRCQCGEREAGLELLARYGGQLERYIRVERAVELHGSRLGVEAYRRLFLLQDRRPYAGRNGVHALLARIAVRAGSRRMQAMPAAERAQRGDAGNRPEVWLAELVDGEGGGGALATRAIAESEVVLDKALVEMPAHPRQALMYGSILCAQAPAAAHWIGFQREADYLAVWNRARMEWLRRAEANLREAARRPDEHA